VKIVTTGEGGLATTNNEALARRMTMLRSHGITREPGEMDQPSHGPWYYQQVALGFNYRMTEMQAALGLSQFDRLDGYVAERERLAVRYDRLLAGCGLQLPWQLPAGRSARHLYVVRTGSKDPVEHGRVFSALQRAGIGANLHYIPVHLQPWYAAMGFAAGQFPEAEHYYAEAISIPLYPTMGDGRQDQVVAAMRAALAQGGETDGAEAPAVPVTAA
jgi:dTDP-4-amino-4,6-dideoxygalactose transaminase